MRRLLFGGTRPILPPPTRVLSSVSALSSSLFLVSPPHNNIYNSRIILVRSAWNFSTNSGEDENKKEEEEIKFSFFNKIEIGLSLLVLAGLIVALMYLKLTATKVPFPNINRFQNVNSKESLFGSNAIRYRDEFLFMEYHKYGELPRSHDLVRKAYNVLNNIMTAVDARAKVDLEWVPVLESLKKQEVKISILKSPDALALTSPSGIITLYLGLWEKGVVGRWSEAELAVILGHELGHLIANHCLEGRVPIPNQVEERVLENAPPLERLFTHGVTQEHEADVIGYNLMVLACYDPDAVRRVWARLEEIGDETINRFHDRRKNYVDEMMRSVVDISDVCERNATFLSDLEQEENPFPSPNPAWLNSNQKPTLDASTVPRPYLQTESNVPIASKSSPNSDSSSSSGFCSYPGTKSSAPRIAPNETYSKSEYDPQIAASNHSKLDYEIRLDTVFHPQDDLSHSSSNSWSRTLRPRPLSQNDKEDDDFDDFDDDL